MDIRIRVSESLAAQARSRGLSIEDYVQEILARETMSEQPLESVREAVDRIRGMRKGNTLAGLKTKDLIHEGHKY